MARVQIPQFLYQVDYNYPGSQPEWRLSSSDEMGDRYWTLVGPVNTEVEVPDNFDPRAAKIAALEAEKVKVRAEFAARITEIERQISEKQAITFEAREVAA